MTEDVTRAVRQRIRQMLNEDDAYGGFDVYDITSPYGISFGSEKDLYTVFVKPFTDVVDTAVGKTKELSQHAQTLAKVAFEAMATSLIPALEDDYKEIFANEKEELDKLKAQYKDVYDATWSAFKDNDVVMAAFMYSPSALITAKAAQQAPLQTIKLLNVLTGGRLDNFFQKVSKALHLGDYKKPLGHDEGPGLAGEVTVRRIPGSDPILLELHKKPSAGSVLTQKKIKQTINADPNTLKMREATRAVVDDMVNKVLQRAQAVASAKSVEELQKKLGVKLKGAEKLAQVPDQEKAALEQPLMKGLKLSALSMYLKGLQQHIETLQKAGVPNNHPMMLMLSGAVSKIKGMA